MASDMKCNVSEMWSPKMPKGLDLEISHHPMTMKRVANLIIAMERLKADTSEILLSPERRDENLLSIMMESMVEKRVVFECQAAPSGQFTRTCQHRCSVTDAQKRHLVKDPNSMELNAVTLQAGSENLKVQLKMSTYLPPLPSSVASARPVALCITQSTESDKDIYLCCKMEGDEPTLHLEPVENINDLKSISSDSDMVKFLFYTELSGVNITTFRSALFPDWYISTAEEENQAVDMCTVDDTRHRTFQIKSKTPLNQCKPFARARMQRS